MKILMLLGGSQYGAGIYFLKSLAEGLEKLGCVVEILDLNYSVIEERIEKEKICRTKIFDAVFLFNAAGIDYIKKILRDENTIIWNMMVDHPYQHMYRMDISGGNCIVSVLDYNHIKFLEQYYKNLEYITFMPLGGGESKRKVAYDKKKYDVIFTGSYGDTSVYADKLNKYSKEIQQFLKEIICKLHEGQETYEDLLLEGLKENQFDEYTYRELLEEFLFIDGYVRQLNRIMMLEAIVSQKIHVHVWGNGWEKYQNNYSEYLHIHPACTFDESLEIMADAKIVLNNIPLFRNGSHDRVFSAMLCGAVCVSERTIYLEEEFKDGEEIIFFDFKNLEVLSLKIKFLLENPLLAEYIALCGYQKAKNGHTWDVRAEQILNVLQQVKDIQKNDLKEGEWSFIDNRNQCDEEFNNILKLVHRVNEETLYEKLKHAYMGLVTMNPAHVISLEKFFLTYPYWGELSYEKRKFEVQRQRTHILKTQIEEFIWLYERLEDVFSRKVLTSILTHWICQTEESLNGLTTAYYEQYFDLDLISCTDNEVLVDIGAYTGDTLIRFMHNFNNYQKIYCYERDKNISSHLEKVAGYYKNVEVRKDALEKLDEDIKEKITFLKIDVKGSEKYVLEGAKKHITEEHPKLVITIYGNEDIIRLPRMIDKMYSDYRFYLRYYGGSLYLSELVLYAIPY